MPGVWTEPKTWVDGETPTGAQFNTQIRDNLNYLKSGPTYEGDVTVQGDITATGVSISGDGSVGDDLAVGGDITVNGNTVLNGDVALGNAATDVVDIKGTVVNAQLKTYTETRTDPVITAGALTLDCLLGTYFKVALNANCTVTILNAPAAGRALGIAIILIADGTVRTVTWPASVKWPNGTTPVLTGTAGKRDVFTLVTEDNGVTWFGVVVGQNY